MQPLTLQGEPSHYTCMGKEAAPAWITERLNRSPVRRERKRYFRDLTTFARLSHVQFSVAYLTELACYTRIPTAIWVALRKKGVDMSALEDQYFEFQKQSRMDFGAEFIVDHLDNLVDFVSSDTTLRDISPIERARHFLGFSRSEWAKGLCIQPATFYRLETGRSNEFPIALMQALYQAGVPFHVVKDWNEQSRNYATSK